MNLKSVVMVSMKGQKAVGIKRVSVGKAVKEGFNPKASYRVYEGDYVCKSSNPAAVFFSNPEKANDFYRRLK